MSDEGAVSIGGTILVCTILVLSTVFGRGCSGTRSSNFDHYLKAAHDYEVPGVDYETKVETEDE